MRKNNLVARRNVRNSKQALVESIMSKVAPIVKNALNESYTDNYYTILIVVYKDGKGVLPVLLNPLYKGNEIVYAMDSNTAFGFKISLTKESRILFDEFLRMQNEETSIPMTINDVEAIYEVGRISPNEVEDMIYDVDTPYVAFFTKDDIDEY